MEKVTDIIESIANEKGLEIEEVKERVKLAFIQTAKQLFGEQYLYDGVIDPQTKKIKLFFSSRKEVFPSYFFDIWIIV